MLGMASVNGSSSKARRLIEMTAAYKPLDGVPDEFIGADSRPRGHWLEFFDKMAGLGSDDIVVTVATDGAEMYGSERQKAMARRFSGTFDAVTAAEVFAQYMLGAATDHLLELSVVDRTRIFNLGYYTWVEQQGCSVEEFVARKDQSFWHALQELVPAWDEMIETANREARATVV